MGAQLPLPEKGNAPHFRPMSIVFKRSPISAAAELLYYMRISNFFLLEYSDYCVLCVILCRVHAHVVVCTFFQLFDKGKSKGKGFPILDTERWARS